jgi:hypothetical protein
VPTPSVDAETAAMRVPLAVVDAEVKDVRSEMHAEAIDMTRFSLVSLVGTEDWVARN